MQDSKDLPTPKGHGRLLPIVDSERSLDSQQLHDLEQTFRRWVASSRRSDHRHSRERILLIFLIIRYTGARLNEVLSLDPVRDFDLDHQTIRFGKRHGGSDFAGREVQVPESIGVDIRAMTIDVEAKWPAGSVFRIDPAHIRRKFYEQATAIGIPPSLGTPEIIRRSRAVELMRNNMPLPVIQKILGHSTPNLAASYVEFSDREINQVAKYFADRENRRKTSARNTFFGKIGTTRQGDIQSIVEMVSVSGNVVTSIITSDSLNRIGLQPGMLVTAEVKAPLIQLTKADDAPRCSADNLFQGKVTLVTANKTTAEVVVCLSDGTKLCAIITQKSRKEMDIKKDDMLWVFFNAFAVVLHVE